MTFNSINWMAAYTRSCQEKSVGAALEKLGIESYVPTRKVKRKWSDRIKTVEKLVIPRIIFVHCTERQRLDSLKYVPGLTHYITLSGPHTPAIIPDEQMETFRRMVENVEIPLQFCDVPLSVGDKVRVVTGPLSGYEFQIANIQGKRYLALPLGNVGSTIIELKGVEVEKIN